MNGSPLWGKYRGQVSMNIDPENRGRIRAKVKGFANLEASWALPSVPFAGKDVGLFLIPPVDAWVWIEFEQGDIGSPIWSGCFWEKGECPLTLALPTKRVLKTSTATVTIDDLPGIGGVTIETKQGMKIKLTAKGIEITNGVAKIELLAASVRINGTALEIT